MNNGHLRVTLHRMRQSFQIERMKQPVLWLEFGCDSDDLWLVDQQFVLEHWWDQRNPAKAR